MFTSVLLKNGKNLGRGVHFVRFRGEDFFPCTPLSGAEDPAGCHGVCHRLELKKQFRLPYEVFCVTLIAGKSSQLMGSEAVQHRWLWCWWFLNRVVCSVFSHSCWSVLLLSFL